MKKYGKYNHKKTIIDGLIFDSKKEAERYQELKKLEALGLIERLERQKKFEIVPKAGNNTRAKYYICDFFYHDNRKDVTVIEDVKSEFTRKDPLYRLKRSLMLYLYPEYLFFECV